MSEPFRSIDTEIFLLGDQREAISRWFALRDEEVRGDPITHWGIVRFSSEQVQAALEEDGDLVVTKLRLVSEPQHYLDPSDLLADQLYQEANYDEFGEWLTLDDLRFWDQENGTL